MRKSKLEGEPLRVSAAEMNRVLYAAEHHYAMEDRIKFKKLPVLSLFVSQFVTETVFIKTDAKSATQLTGPKSAEYASVRFPDDQLCLPIVAAITIDC